MDKKVSPEQIERLYKFTREHFVEYYDLQTELVDHLANAIEAKWEKEPQLDFETALQHEFKKFGVFGFMDVVEKRQLALTKTYYKLIWKYFKGFFKLPRVLLTVAAVFITYQLIRFEPLAYLVILTLILPLSGLKLFFIHKKYKAKVRATGKRWLFEDLIFKCGGSGFLIYIIFQLLQLDVVEENPPYVILAAAMVIVLIMLYDYIVLFVIPAKAEEHLKATYPEYNLEITR